MKQQTYQILILTDHKNHSPENSLYALSRAMSTLPQVRRLDVASRARSKNAAFFNGTNVERIHVLRVSPAFAMQEPHPLDGTLDERKPSDYDFVWLRMPPPLTPDFLHTLERAFPKQVVANHPRGIYETGSKAFLMNVADLCPPMQICQTTEDILAFKTNFPIVLKPFRDYGGRGIVKIDGDQVSAGDAHQSLETFLASLPPPPLNYLGVKYLKHVGQGDKRIVVADGKILGASLRLPPEGSWICNVAMGGTSNFAEVDTDEENIVKRLNPLLKKMGIIMYGIDTLVNDNGRRVLSEINTTSIGGLPQIAQMSKQPIIEEAVQTILHYFIQNK